MRHACCIFDNVISEIHYTIDEVSENTRQFRFAELIQSEFLQVILLLHHKN